MIAKFTDPYDGKELSLETRGLPWGGHNGDSFIDAIDIETKEKVTLCSSEVKVEISLLRLFSITNALEAMKKILRYL